MKNIPLPGSAVGSREWRVIARGKAGSNENFPSVHPLAVLLGPTLSRIYRRDGERVYVSRSSDLNFFVDEDSLRLEIVRRSL